MNKAVVLVVMPGMCLFALLCACTGDQDIVLGPRSGVGAIMGRVYPFRSNVRVDLVAEDSTVSLSTAADPENGHFAFPEIAFGEYAIEASCGRWAGSSKAEVWSVTPTYRQVSMNYAPDLCSYAEFEPGDSITPFDARLAECTMLWRWESGVWIDSANDPIDLKPAHLERCVTIENLGRETLFTFPVDSLFKEKEIDLTIRLGKYIDGKRRHDSLEIDLQIDSSGLDSIMTRKMFSRLWSPWVTFGEEYDTLNREGPIRIYFRYDMERNAVEKAITMEPSFQPTFVWAGKTLEIFPANSLLPGTAYTIRIDTEAMTSDSVPFRIPYAIVATTKEDAEFFHDTWPRNGARHVPLNIPFSFDSRYALDPVLLEEAFSIEPDVDSLSFEERTDGLVLVHHADLEPETSYRMHVLPSVLSRLGTKLEDTLTIEFATEKAL
jgi:hypothetical protein